ncbi:MAG: GNAT family N-acetyltransferase [Planctomycetales bacterium]|nr:GNAT family N-acetyltransferase [Planctomycetales bacterium]
MEVRPACPNDWPTIVDFNSRLAWESEHTRLDRTRIEPGVRNLLADERRGRYFMACCGGRIVGQLMITFEWSDWRNGNIWWLQSVYVEAEFRGRGVFRTLFEHVWHQVESDSEIAGLRLYVEQGNVSAQEVYLRMGMHAAGYLVMERMKPGLVEKP